jgi:hypothetical protein
MSRLDLLAQPGEHRRRFGAQARDERIERLRVGGERGVSARQMRSRDQQPFHVLSELSDGLSRHGLLTCPNAPHDRRAARAHLDYSDFASAGVATAFFDAWR